MYFRMNRWLINACFLLMHLTCFITSSFAAVSKEYQGFLSFLGSTPGMGLLQKCDACVSGISQITERAIFVRELYPPYAEMHATLNSLSAVLDDPTKGPLAEELLLRTKTLFNEYLRAVHTGAEPTDISAREKEPPLTFEETGRYMATLGDRFFPKGWDSSTLVYYKEARALPVDQRKAMLDQSLFLEMDWSPRSRGDYRGANLSRKTLGALVDRELRLDESDFAFANLESAKVSSASLVRASFSYATLAGSVFENVDFRGASFDHADLRNTQFINCQFDDVNINKANMTGAMFMDSSLSNAEGDMAIGLTPEIAERMWKKTSAYGKWRRTARELAKYEQREKAQRRTSLKLELQRMAVVLVRACEQMLLDTFSR